MDYIPISGGGTTGGTPPITGGGSSGGNVLGAVGKIGAVSNLLGGIISPEVIGKTIGQALKDGFKCWGSTWTPTRAENEGPYWISLIAGEFKKSLDVPREELETSVNNFFKTFWGKIASDYDSSKTLESWLGWRYDSARDCTKEGLIRLERIVDTYLVQLEATLKEIGPEINASISVRRENVTLYRNPNKTKPYQKSVPQIKVDLKVNVVEDVKDLAGNKTLQFFGGIGLAILALSALFTKTDGKKRKRRTKSRKLYR